MSPQLLTARSEESDKMIRFLGNVVRETSPQSRTVDRGLPSAMQSPRSSGSLGKSTTKLDLQAKPYITKGMFVVGIE